MRNTEEIWQEFSNNIFDFIKKRVENEEDVKDIQQEVFIKVHLNIDKLRNISKLKSWLYQITRNVIQDYYREEKRKDFFNNQNSWENNIIRNKAYQEELFCCLDPFIKSLPKKYAQILEMNTFQGLKLEDISKKLDISLSGVKSRIQRAREILKQDFVKCCQYKIGKDGKLQGEQNCQKCKN